MGSLGDSGENTMLTENRRLAEVTEAAERMVLRGKGFAFTEPSP